MKDAVKYGFDCSGQDPNIFVPQGSEPYVSPGESFHMWMQIAGVLVSIVLLVGFLGSLVIRAL